MFLFFVVGCTSQEADTSQTIGDSSWSLEVCNGQEEAQADYQISNIEVEGPELRLDVGYSGGCGEHSWSLCWDESFSVLEEEGTEHKQIELTLLHQTNDSCEMFKTAELSFSLGLLGEDAYHIIMGDRSALYEP